MLKNILLASAVMIAVPALAQNSPTQETTPPAAEQAAPMATEAAPSATETAPQDGAASAEQPAQATQAAPATPAKQPATAEQIATIVDQGFPTYDKDADGDLKSEEFGAWMVALRSSTEPAFTGQSAADKEWIGKAMTAADTDKSGTVNKDELKGFLAPQPA